MKIACRDNLVFVRKNVRVIRNAVDFISEYFFSKCDDVITGAMYLRDAAKRIRILNMLLFTLNKLAAFEQRCNLFCYKGLSFLWSYAMHKGIKCIYSAVKNIER